ncbi:MAG TPA: SurA N-terminal domain-containing protein [Acidiferrobacteraceae bacterium]|nr:SurA N-terminal domain-containing protein [Acidiferrobacteraceae bacterium]
MLSTIREKTQGWIAFLLLAVITVPFALWGIGSYFGGETSSNVARVNGTPISVAEYQQALQQTEQSYEQMLGHKLDPGLFDNPLFRKAALEPLIDRTLLAQHLTHQGYRVSDAQLGAIIRHMSAFRVNHHFNEARYRAVLAENGFPTAAGFEATMRTSVLLQQLQAGLVDSGFVPKSQLDAVLSLQGEQRQIEYRSFTPASYRAQVQITPAAVAAYYKAHQANYTNPEQLQVAYIKLSPADLAQHIQVPLAALQAAYQAHLDRFRMPTERKLAHILIALPPQASAAQQAQALAKAQKIEAELQRGGSFAALAKQDSSDAGSAASGGDLGFLRSGTMPPAFDAAARQLKVGQISPPVRTQYGYHIIKLEAVKPGGVKPFSAVRGVLLRMAQRQTANKEIGRLADRLRRWVYQHPDSLEPAAQALGLPVQQTGWFARGSAGPGIAADPLVLKAALSSPVLDQGRNSSVLRLAHHTYVAVRIAGKRPAVVTPLAQVQPQITAELTAQAEAHAAQQAAQQFLERVRQGTAGASWSSAPVTVTRDAPGLDAELLKAVFRAPKPGAGHPVTGLTPLAVGGYAVFAVQSVQAGDPAKVGIAARGELHSALQAEDTTGLYRDYLANLRKRAKIKIYPKNL